MNLSTDIKYIKGIGPKRALALSKLSINNVEDLITFFPRTYQDRTVITKIVNVFFNQHYCLRKNSKHLYKKTFNEFIGIFR